MAILSQPLHDRMRGATAVLAALVLAGAAAGQANWNQTTLSGDVQFPFSLASADMDADGDPDVLVAELDGPFSWWENVDGDGQTWTERPISTDTDKYHVVVADIDGDGDPDAVTGGLSPDPCVWYENVAGNGTSWTRHVVSGMAVTLRGVHAADVDGDNDLDILGASTLFNQVFWYENRTGDGTTWMTHVIDTIDTPLSVSAGDFDDDGDTDVVVGDSGADVVRWYENLDGAGGSWSTGIVSPLANGVHSVVMVDMDEDDDLDVLSASFHESTVSWHENVDGTGNLWTEHVMNSSGGRFISAEPADLDADGDLDAVSSAFNTGDPPEPLFRVMWHENASGDGLSWIDHPISLSVGKTRAAIAIDVDGDCDLDVLSACDATDEILIHDNDLATGTLCPGGTWQDQLGGTLGVAGQPRLLGDGPLTGGSLVTLTLAEANPSAATLLFASVASSPLPIFGGTLHAFPAIFELSLGTDPIGGLFLQGPWPNNVPPGIPFTFQYLVQDPTSIYGVTLSNGQRGTTP